MGNNIIDVDIEQKDQEIYMTFKTTSLEELDSTTEVFAELIQGQDVEKDKNKPDWYHFPLEALACRLRDNNTLEVKEVALNQHASKGAALLLLPNILVEKEIISVEERNMFWERIKNDKIVI